MLASDGLFCTADVTGVDSIFEKVAGWNGAAVARSSLIISATLPKDPVQSLCYPVLVVFTKDTEVLVTDALCEQNRKCQESPLLQEPLVGNRRDAEA